MDSGPPPPPYSTFNKGWVSRIGGLKWAPPCHISDSLRLPPSTMCLPLSAILAHLIPISSLPPVTSCHVPLSLSQPLPPVSCSHSSTYHIVASLSPSSSHDAWCHNLHLPPGPPHTSHPPHEFPMVRPSYTSSIWVPSRSSPAK
jgi:hypothetical protein